MLKRIVLPAIALHNRDDEKRKAMAKQKFVHIGADELRKHFLKAATGDPKDARNFFTRLRFIDDYNNKDY